MPNPPIPANEMDRIISLSEYDLDYSNHQESFKDLVKLAAKVAGTDISLINLIDTYNLWTISNHGLGNGPTPREETVCQYTIMNDDHFEVTDFRTDDRFKDKGFVTGDPNLRYYYGVPLKTGNGQNLGALCVIDTELKDLSPEKTELLKIIADEVVNRLKSIKVIDDLKSKLNEATQTQKKVAHDIRGPLGGIIGLAQVIKEQGYENQMEEVLEFVTMIYKSGRSVLELADEILTSNEIKPLGADEFNLLLLKDKLEKLYQPQALNKKIYFEVNISQGSATRPFSKNKLLQIIGNLISNAIKFTPIDGSVTVDLDLNVEETATLLEIRVTDTGIGLNPAAIHNILTDKASSTNGTSGEKGYGFGLALVKYLIDGLNGTFNIHSEPGVGSIFEVSLPQNG